MIVELRLSFNFTISAFKVANSSASLFLFSSLNFDLKFKYKIYVTRIVGIKEEVVPHILLQNFEINKFKKSKELIIHNLSKFTNESTAQIVR